MDVYKFAKETFGYDQWSTCSTQSISKICGFTCKVFVIISRIWRVLYLVYSIPTKIEQLENYKLVYICMHVQEGRFTQNQSKNKAVSKLQTTITTYSPGTVLFYVVIASTYLENCLYSFVRILSGQTSLIKLVALIPIKNSITICMGLSCCYRGWGHYWEMHPLLIMPITGRRSPSIYDSH